MKVQEGGSYEELVDPRLGDTYDPKEMLQMVACAGACIRHSARGRPKMSQVLRLISDNLVSDRSTRQDLLSIIHAWPG